MFTKEQRGTWKYWFAHWCAFQMTALNLGAWKPRFLLHDILKPFQMWFYHKNYKIVQEVHRHNARHHLNYWVDRELTEEAFNKLDFEAMVIDWECSRFTKEAAQMNACDTLEMVLTKMHDGHYNSYCKHNPNIILIMEPDMISSFEMRVRYILNRYGLTKSNKANQISKNNE